MTTIDTLTVQRRLREAGFADAQATALTQVMQDVVSSHAATKADLDRVDQNLRIEIHRQTIPFGVMLGAGLTLLFLALQYAPT